MVKSGYVRNGASSTRISAYAVATELPAAIDGNRFSGNAVSKP